MDPGGAIPCPDPAAAADPRADSPAPGGLKSPVAPATPDPALNPRDPESLTLALDEVLRLEKCYETPEGLVKRREVLKNLNVLVKQWIQSVSLSRGMHWQDIDKIGGRIVTYGSYMLGISNQGADIDALCVAPQHITRQEYFSSFLSLLSFQTEVTDLRAIEEAYVPVLKMRFGGIEIDMTFARLNLAEVPGDAADFCRLPLENLDAKCVRSLNGYRSTQELLRLVPNQETFRITLRAIKLWAKGQGLYSNILGYLGGFSWAVLVAKTCLLYPADCTGAEMVRNFFELFSAWRWPAPVALNDYASAAPSPAGEMSQPSPQPQPQPQSQCMAPTCAQPPPPQPQSTLVGANGLLSSLQSAAAYQANPHLQQQQQQQQHSSWNPDRNPQERHQVMPIITPTYPHMNSTFNVTSSTLKLIQEKMTRAQQLCNKIFNGEETWNTLFKTNHIFDEYHHFLVVVATANNYIQWFGLIESKIRHFLNNIEKECYLYLQAARIWPKPLTKKGDSKSSMTMQLWFVGLEFDPKVKEVRPDMIDISKPLKNFQDTLRSQARLFYSDDMKINAHYVQDLTGKLDPNDIQEIISSQSQKRERTPPPPPAAAAATSSAAAFSSGATSVLQGFAGLSLHPPPLGGGGGGVGLLPPQPPHSQQPRNPAQPPPPPPHSSSSASSASSSRPSSELGDSAADAVASMGGVSSVDGVYGSFHSAATIRQQQPATSSATPTNSISGNSSASNVDTALDGLVGSSASTSYADAVSKSSSCGASTSSGTTTLSGGGSSSSSDDTLQQHRQHMLQLPPTSIPPPPVSPGGISNASSTSNASSSANLPPPGGPFASVGTSALGVAPPIVPKGPPPSLTNLTQLGLSNIPPPPIPSQHRVNNGFFGGSPSSGGGQHHLQQQQHHTAAARHHHPYPMPMQPHHAAAVIPNGYHPYPHHHHHHAHPHSHHYPAPHHHHHHHHHHSGHHQSMALPTASGLGGGGFPHHPLVHTHPPPAPPPPPHHLHSPQGGGGSGGIMLSRSPVMERTWNTHASGTRVAKTGVIRTGTGTFSSPQSPQHQRLGGGGGSGLSSPMSGARNVMENGVFKTSGKQKHCNSEWSSCAAAVVPSTPTSSSSGPQPQPPPHPPPPPPHAIRGGATDFEGGATSAAAVAATANGAAIATNNNNNGGGGGDSTSSFLDVSYGSLESENGRSVSLSSDKFPPPALIQARLHHADKIPPFSPIATTAQQQPSQPAVIASSSSSSSTAVTSSAGPVTSTVSYLSPAATPPTTVNTPPPTPPPTAAAAAAAVSYDASVPPPVSPIVAVASPGEGAPAAPGGGGSRNFGGGGGRQQHRGGKGVSSGSQRLSSSELRDVSTPAPIHRPQFQPLHFNFNMSSIQQMKAAATAAGPAAADSVFN